MNRREVMAGGVALLGASAIGGGVYVVRSDDTVKGWIEDIVTRHLPGVQIAKDDLARYSADKMRELGGSLSHRLYTAGLSTGVDLSKFSEGMRGKVEALERKTVSDFLLRSNFFFLNDPTKETVSYEGDGPSACRNPFAVLD